jgi:hypothetical protein
MAVERQQTIVIKAFMIFLLMLVNGDFEMGWVTLGGRVQHSSNFFTLFGC